MSRRAVAFGVAKRDQLGSDSGVICPLIERVRYQIPFGVALALKKTLRKNGKDLVRIRRQVL